MTQKLVLSATRVNTFQQCRRKYYYTYKEKIPTKEWEHFDIGTLVHGALERFHDKFRKDGSEINLRHLMKTSFSSQRSDMESKRVLSNDVLITSRDILTEYLKLLEKDGIGSEIISLEEKFNMDLSDNVGISGFIDRIDIDNDGIYHIKDYKTSKSHKYMKPFQLCVYGIYLLSKYSNIDYFRGSYVMVRCGGIYVSYNFNSYDIKKCKNELVECADHIREEQRWLPTYSALCDWCDFKNICLSTW